MILGENSIQANVKPYTVSELANYWHSHSPLFPVNINIANTIVCNIYVHWKKGINNTASGYKSN